ncbi:MAG: glycosyltransferase [Desulfobacteraceae bacterium]|nr:MAG: glycosyltransferase [Desulfobacteraceae bacterium]
MNIRISFIILTWNCNRYINKCIDSIIRACRTEEVAFEIIIVDNYSVDGTRDIVKDYQERLPEVVVAFYLDANKGTTFTRNIGIKKSRGKYICILDSDAEILSGSLTDILQLMRNDHALGIVAPKLVLPDGQIQNSVKKFPSLLGKLAKLPKIFFGWKMPNADFYADFPFQKERKVDQAISACWFLRKEVIDCVGLLDEKIFYAPEDMEYCRRMKDFGKNILYYPDFVVLHNTQQISHKNPFSKVSISHFWGLLHYYRKYGGWISPK